MITPSILSLPCYVSFQSLYIFKQAISGYSRKKSKQGGGGWGYGIPGGIGERTCENSRGQLKQNWNFWRCSRKNHVEFSTEKTIWEVYFKYTSFILQILKVQKKYASSEFPKKKYQWSIKTEKNKKVLFYTSTILYLCFLTLSEMTYTSSILLSLKRNNLFRKSTSNILLNLCRNTPV